MKKLWFLLIIPVLLVAWWLADVGQSIPSVRYAVAGRETVESVVSTNGKLEPLNYAAAVAEVAGVIEDVTVERGQNVRQGDVLVHLDDAAERAALNTQLAQLEEAKAELNAARQGGKFSLRTDLQGKLGSAQLALDEAQRRCDSVNRLYAKQAATLEEKQAAAAALANARQQMESIQANEKALVTPADVNIATAKVRDAQAAYELAQHRLALMTIRSPISGTIYQLDKKKGGYLRVGDLIAMIGNLDQMRVRVYVDEPDLGRVALNMPVTITWQARPGQKWQGHVSQVPTEVTALQSRQVGVVMCTIDNPNHELLPGTNVDANIISKIVENAVSIPKQALQTTKDGTGVWKLIGDRIRWQPVSAGVSDIAHLEIKSGLKIGDRVVLPSDTILSNGVRVNASASEEQEK